MITDGRLTELTKITKEAGSISSAEVRAVAEELLLHRTLNADETFGVDASAETERLMKRLDAAVVMVAIPTEPGRLQALALMAEGAMLKDPADENGFVAGDRHKLAQLMAAFATLHDLAGIQAHRLALLLKEGKLPMLKPGSDGPPERAN